MIYQTTRTLALCLAPAMALALPSAGHAQSGDTSLSREVVQPLPSPDVQRLNSALNRLAANSQDLRALIDAGNAALALGDLDAAMGFFGRAQELSPNNADAKMGMAAIFLRSDRPIDALRLFAEAEKAGASPDAVLGERGLAFDLVGNNAEAQASYRAALTRGSNAEITRRLALSQAIAGDKTAFEATLRPLLDKRDFAAYRTRAFGLAILGNGKEALAITDAVMPKDLASRISPYLDYMPRLTKAQQAAAANLGIFPRAAQIGRDDPRIAQYASSGTPNATQAGAKLAPQGEPLGTALARNDTPAESKASKSKPKPSRSKRKKQDQAMAMGSRAEVVTTPIASSAASQPAPAAVALQSSPPATVTPPAATQELPPVSGSSRLAAVAREQAAPPATPPAAQPSISTFDLARVPSSASPATVQPAQAAQTPAALPAVTQQAVVQPPVAQQPAPSVADAFSDFAVRSTGEAASGAGAVDITAIKVPREKPPEPPKPKEPEHPSRVWVQVATGKDLNALKFDWRRISRKAPDQLGDFKPFVTPWGEANRLLAGPLANPAKARELVAALKQAGVDSFTFTSEKGQQINALN